MRNFRLSSNVHGAPACPQDSPAPPERHHNSLTSQGSTCNDASQKRSRSRARHFGHLLVLARAPTMLQVPQQAHKHGRRQDCLRRAGIISQAAKKLHAAQQLVAWKSEDKSTLLLSRAGHSRIPQKLTETATDIQLKTCNNAAQSYAAASAGQLTGFDCSGQMSEARHWPVPASLPACS